MRTVLGIITTFALSLAASSSVGAGQVVASEGTKWVCKTSPIWNGRSSGPRYTTGATRDQAFSQAEGLCRNSGQYDYCKSSISCWQE